MDALSRAAGIPIVVNAVERDYRQEAWARTGWPFTRWARALRPDPLKRLRLGKGEKDSRDAGTQLLPGVSAAEVRSALGRSSLPPPTPAARSAVELATRRVGERAGQGLPIPWAEAAADAATPPGPELADTLDQAIISTPLRARDPLWWTVFGYAQWLFAAATVVGLVWLAGAGGRGLAAAARDRDAAAGAAAVPVPAARRRAAVRACCWRRLARALARVGARRRAELIRHRLRESVSRVASEHIVAPVREVLRRHAATREQLDRARA